jgi:hypothetical protein
VYKQTNKLLLVIIERKRETKKSNFFLSPFFFLQNIHQLDTVHLVRGGVGVCDRDLGALGEMQLQSIRAHLECSDIHTIAAAKVC